jgi:hypothetical protein
MSREDNIYYARLAEQGERYEDMIKYMKLVSNVSHSSLWNFTLKIFNYKSTFKRLKTTI